MDQLTDSMFSASYITQNINNIIWFVVGSVIFFLIIRGILRLIDYVIFKTLLNAILDEVFDEDDEDPYADYKILPNSNTEDEHLFGKNKQKELEQKVEILNDRRPNFNKEKTQKKIVGIAYKVLGPWTAKFAGKIIDVLKQIDPNELQTLGFNQAKELARRRQSGVAAGKGQGGGRGVG